MRSDAYLLPGEYDPTESSSLEELHTDTNPVSLTLQDKASPRGRPMCGPLGKRVPSQDGVAPPGCLPLSLRQDSTRPCHRCQTVRGYLFRLAPRKLWTSWPWGLCLLPPGPGEGSVGLPVSLQQFTPLSRPAQPTAQLLLCAGGWLYPLLHTGRHLPRPTQREDHH